MKPRTSNCKRCDGEDFLGEDELCEDCREILSLREKVRWFGNELAGARGVLRAICILWETDKVAFSLGDAYRMAKRGLGEADE